MSDYSTKQIIDYAMDDNGSEFRNALYASIHDKVTAHIEAKKQEVAENLLGLNDNEEEEYELEEAELDESLGSVDAVKKMAQNFSKSGVPTHVIKHAGQISVAQKPNKDAEILHTYNHGKEVEQIDELSKKTLGSYSRKSMDDLNLTSHLRSGLQQQKMYGTMHPDHEKEKTIDNLTRTNTKRQAGLHKAITRLSKEEVEESFISEKNTEDDEHFDNGYEHGRSAANDAGFKEKAKSIKKDMLADNPHKKGTPAHQAWHQGASEGHQDALDLDM
jgi:hypothetical protein